MNERAWRALIGQIRDGLVVPVVGPQLLVDAQGGSLQRQVALRLLDTYGEQAPPAGLTPHRELNDAVELLARQADSDPDIRPQDFYIDVADAIGEIVGTHATIPEPLRQLAEITDLSLFVTLTPDDLLQRALAARGPVREVIHSPRLPTTESSDLPADWQRHPGEAHLLYLFGKARRGPYFAIHDEDVLEHAHNIMAQGSHVPRVFLGELQERSLLILGCNFPDWMSRFFLRITNRTRLSEKAKREWLVEPLAPEAGLTAFLQCHSKETRVLDSIPPVDFVAELHRRWMADRPASAPGAAAPAPGDATLPREPMFFISYSRPTDAARAETMYLSLLALGVAPGDIWFDRLAIEPGQDFALRILDGIRSCRYFLPLLSEGVDAREEAFVFREWRTASERNEAMNRHFIFPVIVDADYRPEAFTAASIRTWQGIDFGHAPDGQPDERLGRKLRDLVREARRARAPEAA